MPHLLAEKNIVLFERHRVFSRTELESRHEIMLSNYSKIVNIEARTMLAMARRDILPAVCGYVKELTEAIVFKKQLGNIDASYESETAQSLSAMLAEAHAKTHALDDALKNKGNYKGSSLELGCYYRDVIIPAMKALRSVVDEMEKVTAARCWPYPCYGDLLFNVK